MTAANILVIDGCDDAIIGYCAQEHKTTAVYCYDKLVQFRQDDEMDEGDLQDMAVEWIQFNIVGAYVGPNMPVIVYPGDRDMIDELADQEAEET